MHQQTHVDLKARFQGFLNTIAATPLTVALMLAVSAATTARGVTFERHISLTPYFVESTFIAFLPEFPSTKGTLTSVSIRVSGKYHSVVDWANYGTEINTMQLTLRPSVGVQGFIRDGIYEWGAGVSMKGEIAMTLQPNERVQGHVFLSNDATIPIENINAFYSPQRILGGAMPPSKDWGTFKLRQTGKYGEVSLLSCCEPTLSASVLYEYQPPGAIPEAEEYGLAFSALLLISAVSRSVLRR